ncbi:MAG: HlyD family efflux transporter periplasmic adaptor subunit [Pirellulaceae bacterium]|nr:HlyD family efflux transporter periplasmic adaptor subunit [Pirellulaceae bacterium]
MSSEPIPQPQKSSSQKRTLHTKRKSRKDDSTIPFPTANPSENQLPNSASQRSANPADHIGEKLLLETRSQIQSLVHEIEAIIAQNPDPHVFASEFLPRVVEALAAPAGLLWEIDKGVISDLSFQVNNNDLPLLQNRETQEKHQQFLAIFLKKAKPTVLLPGEKGNPTGYLRIIVPLYLDQSLVDVSQDVPKGKTVIGLLEIFQRPQQDPKIRHGYLNFLQNMSRLASTYFKDRHLRHLVRMQSQWQPQQQFIRQVHQSLDWKKTAYTVVNEGRHLTNVDRVSLLNIRGSKVEVVATSGIDQIQPRSQTNIALTKLVSSVSQTLKPFHYEEPSPSANESIAPLPPQLEAPLQHYLDLSHTKALRIEPLFYREGNTSSQEHPKKKKKHLVGLLLFERLKQGTFAPKDRNLIASAVEHSTLALGNAKEHSHLFLLPLWKKLGVIRKELPQSRTTTLFLIFFATLATLFCIPADFKMFAKGELQPVVGQQVFSPYEGLVEEVFVEHGQKVKAGQPLAQLYNANFDLQTNKLEGDLRNVQEKIFAHEQKFNHQKLSQQEELQVSGNLTQLRQEEENILRQQHLQQLKQKQLTIHSPLDGQITTWQVKKQLTQRPVQQGQTLMKIVQATGQWQLELQVPERRLKHLLAHQKKEKLTVHFTLATLPGESFYGTVTQIDTTTTRTPEGKQFVPVYVAVEREKIPDLRPSASVSAQILCGRQSLGYVIFQDFIETIQTKAALWW